MWRFMQHQTTTPQGHRLVRSQGARPAPSPSFSGPLEPEGEFGGVKSVKTCTVSAPYRKRAYLTQN